MLTYEEFKKRAVRVTPHVSYVSEQDSAPQVPIQPAANPAPAPSASPANTTQTTQERRQVPVGRNSLVFADTDMFSKELADGETFGGRIDALTGRLKDALGSDKVPAHVPAAGRRIYQRAIDSLHSLRNAAAGLPGGKLDLNDPQNIADIRTMLQYNPDFTNSVINAIYNASPEAVAMMTPEALAGVNKFLPPVQAKKINDAVAYMRQANAPQTATTTQPAAAAAQQPAALSNANGLLGAIMNPQRYQNMPAPGLRVPKDPTTFSSPEEQAAYVDTYGEPPMPADNVHDTGMWTAPADQNMFKMDPDADDDANMRGMISDFLAFALPNMQAYQTRHGTNTLPTLGKVLSDDPDVMNQFLSAAENSDMQSKSMMLKAMREMADSKDPEKYAMFQEQWNSLTDEQKTKITDAFKSSVYTNLKENFFKDLPTAISLWFRMQGWDTVADWAENPWIFYITLAGMLVGGTALVGGALSGDGNDQPIINVGGSANPYYNNEGRW